MTFRWTTIKTLLGAILSTAALGQNTSNQPDQGSQNSLINVGISNARVSRQSENATFLLRVSSAAGAPVPIAIPFQQASWSVYSSQGTICSGSNLRTQGVPWVSNDGRVDGPTGITAGLRNPALIPVTIACWGFHRGDEISINLVLMVERNGDWIPQHFSFSRMTIE